ncbi:MAG: polysaccharide deacetylase family protein [Lachnospiraceae bacterium]
MLKIYKAFPGGKHKVLTMSYDDGKLADRRLVSIFNKYGIKGTFNLNSGLINDEIRIDPSEWRDLYKGHEVATHTYTHPTIDRCPNTEIVNEYLQDKQFLESVMGYPVRGHAYPNGSYSPRVERIMEDLGIKYGRIVGDYYAEEYNVRQSKKECGIDVVGDTNGFAFPSNFYEWKPTCHHNHNLLGFGQKFKDLKKRQYLYMMYVWGHSYEFDRDNNWDLMEQFCEMMGGQDDIWYATNIEIVDYLEAFDRLQFSADLSIVYNPSFQSLWIVVNDDQIVEIPGGATVALNK